MNKLPVARQRTNLFDFTKESNSKAILGCFCKYKSVFAVKKN